MKLVYMCMLRVVANDILNRLNQNGLKNTSCYRNVASEFDRDLYTGESRLHLVLPKVQPLVEALKEAGRSRPKRRMALAAIKSAKAKVR